jgi:exodeoxyribonuclease V gamma subunit
MIASDEDNAHEHQVIREALADLAAKAEAAGFAEPVAIEIIARELAERLEGARTTAGFLSGGVTFCAMLPMRSIPFRVMALLGMSDRDFPRASRRLGFDLIAAEPRTGDRSTRDDDRYLFLEALLSARERLIVTFTGQSIRDNTDLPPSVVVSELLDTIAEAAGLRQEEVRRRLVVRHPLQPFSPRYFGSSVDARLFSFASGYRDGARAVRGGRDGLAPFVASPLADDDRPGAITLDDLQRFYRLPAKFLLNRRLGIHLREESETSDDREPIKLDPLERYHVGTALLEWGLDAWSASGDTGPPPPAKVARWLESALPALRARGILPLGTPGQCLFEDLSADVGALLSLVVQETAGTRAAPLAVDLALGGVQLAGWLDRVWPRAQVRFGYSKVQPKYELEVWIRHVALCAMNAPGYPRRSVLIGRAANPNHPPSKVAFEPVENAAEVMSDLVGLYAAGRTRPLPFFPGASMAYARACLGGAPHDQALRAARQEFIKNIPGGYGGDGKEPEVERVFGDRDPLELAEFAEVACRVLSPLIAHRVEQD